MFGFVIAAVSVFALVNVLRRVGRWRRFGYGGYAGPGCHGGWRRSYGPRSWMRSVLGRLGTTPDQEKVILGALAELRSNRASIVEEANATRAELASALTSGLIDDATLDEMFARHDRLLARIRVSFVEALRHATEALDERQRKELATLLRSGRSGRFGWGRPWNEDNMWA